MRVNPNCRSRDLIYGSDFMKKSGNQEKIGIVENLSGKYFRLQVVVPVEVAKRLMKTPKEESKFLLLGYEGLSYLSIMSNEPAIDKVVISYQIDAALKQRLKRAADERKMTLSSFIVFTLTEAVRDVTLTSEDYEEIKRTVQKNEQRRRARRGGN